MTTLPTDRIVDLLAAQSDNRTAFESMQNYMALPAPTYIARPEAVFVSVPDADDLLPWIFELGGVIHKSPAFEGVELWTLHTQTPADGRGHRGEIRVSVPLPVGEPVMPEVAQAVSA